MAKEADKATAMWVVRRLRAEGYEALFAGGCVRDMLLGARASDYDVATNATPQQVRRIFSRVLLVGARFGVAVVLRRRRRVEVATFRSDLSYSDGRRPDGVVFTSPREDAKRRDFTINGMFYDPLSREVIDYVHGRDDLAAGVVRTIGRPGERFAEDYLRMIRAVRFAVRLDFRIDGRTAIAIRKNAGGIVNVSGERIFEELSKMLSRPTAPRALRKLERLRLAGFILPELFECGEVWPAAVRRVEAVARRRDDVLAFGALMADLPRAAIGRIARRWGASNELRGALLWLRDHRDEWPEAADCPLCRFKRLLADANWQRLRALWAEREKAVTGKLTQHRRIARRAGAIDPRAVAPEPFVTGEDLLKMGLREGRELGRVLRSLYDAQLNEEFATRREAMAAARKMM